MSSLAVILHQPTSGDFLVGVRNEARGGGAYQLNCSRNGSRVQASTSRAPGNVWAGHGNRRHNLRPNISARGEAQTANYLIAIYTPRESGVGGTIWAT